MAGEEPGAPEAPQRSPQAEEVGNSPLAKGAAPASSAERLGEILGAVWTRAEQTVRRVGPAAGTGGLATSSETIEPRALETPVGGSGTGGFDGLWRDPAKRRWLAVGGVALALVLAFAVAVPLSRRGAAPAVVPVAEAPGAEAPASEPAPAPASEAPAPAEGQPAATEPAPAQDTGARQVALSALPLALGLFWLLSAWLVDSEARRAFVVKEPWGDRRTVAYTALAVGCVFPLILAGLIFSAWGFVTFVLDVSRRQNPVAGLQAGALILMACAGFLVLRGMLAQWLDKRRRT